MENRIYDALDEIKAEEKLKQNTCAFLQEKVYQKRKAPYKRFSAVLASIIIFFIAGLTSYNFYFTETAFVDIDVNPSIELTLNRLDRVIGVYAYNDDGRQLLDAVNIKHKSYKEALKMLIDKMAEFGYINDSGLFTATLQVPNGNNEKELLDLLKVYIDSALQADNTVMTQDIFSVASDIKSDSHHLNLTPAKYLAILELQQLDPTATFDSCRDHTISEIKQQVHDHMNGGEHDNSNGHDDSCNDGNHGNNEGH